MSEHAQNQEKRGRGWNIAHMPKCGAMSKRTGKPCQRSAMANGRCMNHGGKSVGGIAHGGHRGKGYSESMKNLDFINIYKEIRTNPDLLALNDEIALVTTRIRDLVSRIGTGEAQSRWKEVKEHWKMLRMAQRREDGVGVAEEMRILDRLLSDADEDYRNWDDLYKAMKMQTSLIAQEQKRRMDMNALVSTEDAIAFISEVMDIVKNNVSDKQELNQIWIQATNAMQKRSRVFGAVESREIAHHAE